jgi:hypothetical protein
MTQFAGLGEPKGKYGALVAKHLGSLVILLTNL